MAQSVRGFRWILFCDATTPEWALDRLRTLIGADDRVEPVFIDGPDSREIWHTAIARGLPPHVTHLVTTRLDNDDGLARRFVETVQEQFTGQDYEFINLPQGHTCFQGRARPLADLEPHYAPQVIAAVGDAPGTWGRHETLAYWARRIEKKFVRLPAA